MLGQKTARGPDLEDRILTPQQDLRNIRTHRSPSLPAPFARESQVLITWAMRSFRRRARIGSEIQRSQVKITKSTTIIVTKNELNGTRILAPSFKLTAIGIGNKRSRASESTVKGESSGKKKNTCLKPRRMFTTLFTN